MTPQEKANEILSIMDKAAAFYFINQLFYEMNRMGLWIPTSRELFWYKVEEIIKAS